MNRGAHRLLLHGIDTLQCAYYLHQERKKEFDFGQLIQTREELSTGTGEQKARHLGRSAQLRL
jgi:hypothetical protein